MKKGTVLITGASQGLGYEFAKIFARKNYDLVLVARNEKKLKEIAAELGENKNINILTISKDLSQASSPQELYDELQKRSLEVNILVNNAGFGTYGEFVDTNLEEELQELQVNIVCLTHLTKLFVKDMKKTGHGKILNVASTAAFLPGPLMAVYYASKAYVLSFSEALHEELKEYNITVTALCPGPTDTGFKKRAKLENSPIFKNGLMKASTVAQSGFDALMRGDSMVITGLKNKVMVNGLRFLPRSIVPMIVKKAQA